jgi:hypothetical protein
MQTQIRRASPVARSALMILAGWAPETAAKVPPHTAFPLADAAAQATVERGDVK